jgi:hypothetical protein
MGVMDFAEANLDEIFSKDEEVAVEFDRLRAARDRSANDAIA